MKTFIVLCMALVLTFSVAVLAKGKGNKYMVTIPHTKEECMTAIDDFNKMGEKTLSRIDWGCMAGDHTAYCTLKAASEADAKKMIPESARKKAKFVQVTKFTPKQIEDMHKK